MKTRAFQLKEILPNPFRDLERNPLSDSMVDTLVASINQDERKNLWESRPLSVRMNEYDCPELVFGHHTIKALRQLHPSTWELECAIEKLTDGQMIARMARENATRKHIDIQTLFEVIRAAVETYGAGKIFVGDGEGKIKPVPRTTPAYLRFAPSYSADVAAQAAYKKQTEIGTVVAVTTVTKFPYTMETLAAFLGFIQPNGQATTPFDAAFGALELLAEGHLTESRIKGLEVYKLDEVVKVTKQARTRALAEAKRLAGEAEARRQDAIRNAAELKKQQEDAEVRRKATAESERVAAVKRAEEKERYDANEKIRLVAEVKRKQIEAEQRAAAEAKRKEEEEKQRKIREAQRAEAEQQRAEAEKVRQIALVKAKKEDDERKAAQMIKDAEAARVRAEADAKRKEEAARQAEIAAKRRAEEEKERQAAAAKKRAEDEVLQAAQRKARQEENVRKEALRAESARLKIIADKKVADDAARKKQEEIDRAIADAKKKDEEAKRETTVAKARIKAVADAAADAIKGMTREKARVEMSFVVEEAEAKHYASVGRGPARHTARPESSYVTVSEETVKRFIEALKNRRTTSTLELKGSVPSSVVKDARELISVGLRTLALKRHPDHGGSQEGMQSLNAAAEWLKLLVSREEEYK